MQNFLVDINLWISILAGLATIIGFILGFGNKHPDNKSEIATY